MLTDVRLVRHLSDLPFELVANGSVVTIGSFDGLHLGHERLLENVLTISRELAVPSVLMSFEPSPKEFFSSGDPPARLMRFREKYEALQEHGVDIFYCPRFAKSMRDISSDAFIRRILIHGLNASHLVIGDDFRFARRREGGVDDLRRCQAALKYSLHQVPSINVDGIRASSTAIRTALDAGDVALATRLLGRPYRMSGKVVKGRQVGRTLGYATANVDLRRRQSAVMGIYAVTVSGIGDEIVHGVASVGTRPTFDLCKPLLEVHLFDFDRDIYGDYIHVDFIEHLRDEVKFESAEELISQMHEDASQARQILESRTA